MNLLSEEQRAGNSYLSLRWIAALGLVYHSDGVGRLETICKTSPQRN